MRAIVAKSSSRSDFAWPDPREASARSARNMGGAGGLKKAPLRGLFRCDPAPKPARRTPRGHAKDVDEFVGRISHAPLGLLQPLRLVADHRSADPVTECHRLAADPNDPGRIGTGVAFDAIESAAAVTACLQAVDANPKDGRLAYELGRAYDAGSNFAAAEKPTSARRPASTLRSDLATSTRAVGVQSPIRSRRSAGSAPLPRLATRTP